MRFDIDTLAQLREAAELADDGDRLVFKTNDGDLVRLRIEQGRVVVQAVLVCDEAGDMDA
jgi:hypothetical protein